MKKRIAALLMTAAMMTAAASSFAYAEEESYTIGISQSRSTALWTTAGKASWRD